MKHAGLIITLCMLAAAAIFAAVLPGRARPGVPALGAGMADIASPTPTTVNVAKYDAKLLSLANLRPQTPCSPSATPSSAKKAPDEILQAAPAIRPAAINRERAALKPCLARLWPPHAVYPNAGALLPFKRIVAYYGNFYSPRMGVLGEYPPDKVLAMLTSTVAKWRAADPSTPVIPAIDYIAVSAQSVPARDGKYRLRMPPGQIEKAIGLGDQIHGLVFLDVQPGWSTIEAELPRLAPYLKRPNVELALDPEFALTDGKRPGAWIGTMSASDINFAARFLARIVRENHLPPKVLVVHRFTERMVTAFSAIKPLPEVEIVMDMDGFGSPVLKVATYKDFIASQPVQFTGFKLFYKNDVKIGHHLMTPSEVLRLSPQPSYILYQ